ncbi:hypothetical protein ACFV2X_54490 [Streptomyces sp. NPDC059679]|uniref:hypothetical protein n=1 Tax=Streptomyces sp. NPDC059679 TaxID=3346903 RepID=UPI0036BA04C6
MKYTLVHTFPDGTERPVSAPLPTIGKAAALAARSLHDNRRAAKDEAAAFADYLATMPVGKPLTHWPSGYAARIECAETIAAPDPGSLRVTKARKGTYLGIEAETWEVRTGGPFSLRTVYRRWVADGQHWVTNDPVMLNNGSFYTGGGPQPHTAGDLYARTIRGDGRKRPFYILAPERQLPQDAPTDQLLLPAK